MIIRGDCIEEMKKMENESVDLIASDPPYGMEFQSHRRKEIYNKIDNDNNLDWIKDFIKESFRVLKDNTHIYLFCSFHNVNIFKQEIERLFKIKNILIWKKNNHGSGDLKGSYAPQYEMIIFAHKGRKELNNGRQSDILEFKKTGNKLHPTEKPVDLMKYIIEKSSNEGDIILDPFMGSGTTGIASLQSFRKFIGIELNEEYFNIAKERIIKIKLQSTLNTKNE